MTWKPGLRPPEDSKTYLWFAEHEKKVIDQCPNKKCCVFLYKSEKWSYTSKNAERNKAVLKSYLISVGNLALLDKDVHCAKWPRETKGRTDTDIIVYDSYEQNWVFIKKNIFAAIKSLEITLLSKVVSRHFFGPLNDDRTFSGWYYKKHYYHNMKLHGPIELTNASK